MGEPVAGDIADGIRLTTQQIKLKTNITGSKGDFLIKDSTNDWFTNVTTTTVAEILAAVTDPGVYQAQEDYDTTGIADGVGLVAVFGSPSRIYAPIAAAIDPGAVVSLHVLVDDSPGPAVVGFGAFTAGTKIGRYIKMSGATVAAESTPANGIAIIDMMGASS
jgi:hypothetical protein